MIDPLSTVLAFVPALVFLALLRAADTFRLVPVRATLRSLGIGGVCAILAALANQGVAGAFDLSGDTMMRLVAPSVEEIAKALWVVILIRTHRCGFQVDAAIHGFAVGAGFALVENAYYLWQLSDTTMSLWIVRGFGTAMMHGSVTAIFGLLAKEISDRHPDRGAWIALVPLPLAIALHTVFNHFYLPALVSTLVVLVAFPLLALGALVRSERATRRWLHAGIDTDVEVLQLLFAGKLPESPVGIYLESLRSGFAPDVVGDMVAYLQVGLELSLEAKGRMLARDAGLDLPSDPESREKIEEFRWLERRLGAAGRFALSPLVIRSSRDVWQMISLDEQSRAGA